MARNGPPPTLTPRQLNRATLARQLLLRRERLTPLRAIETLVAMQAQWPRPPFLGLWSRVAGFARADLARLLERRQVVRATLLRGTLHLVSAKDFVALRPALQPVLAGGLDSILRARGVRLELDRLLRLARGILAEGPRTFEELRERFLRAEPQADERAMGYAVRMLLPLVQVPEGDAAWSFPTRSRFALAEQWLGRAVPAGKSTPADALVWRYLAAYGPASVADAQAWSGLRGLREAVDRLRPRLLAFRDEGGRELFDLPKAPRPDPDVPAPVRLVADYDNVIATRADQRFVARRDRPRVFLSALRIAATVLVDGFVAGTWKLEAKKTAATVTIEPFAPFSPRTRQEVAAEAEALARFAEPGARDFEVRISARS
jgi:winged helix DNA-binding protein